MALQPITKTPFRVSQKFWNKLILNWVDIYAKNGLKWHNGIDYAIPEKTILLATIDWTVELINQRKKGYWLAIKIFKKREDWITEVLYGHLYWTDLKTWDTVVAGQFIWFSGGDPRDENSWTSTWPHLHFGLRFRDLNNKVINEDNWFKGWINPTSYFV